MKANGLDKKLKIMKANRFTVAVCAGIMLLTGCTDRQMQGTMAGGSLGAIFGSSIGGLMGGPRGSDAGTALGMAVGAVVGNAVTSQKNRKGSTNIDDCDDSCNLPPSRRNPRNGGEAAYTSGIDGLQVENIRFVDENRNQTIDAGEHAKILFEIHNAGNSTLYNITPVVSCSEPKRISVSPTAIVENLAPGKAVAYTANVVASQRLKDGEVSFRIAFQDGRRIVTYKDFTLTTKSAK